MKLAKQGHFPLPILSLSSIFLWFAARNWIHHLGITVQCTVYKIQRSCSHGTGIIRPVRWGQFLLQVIVQNFPILNSKFQTSNFVYFTELWSTTLWCFFFNSNDIVWDLVWMMPPLFPIYKDDILFQTEIALIYDAVMLFAVALDSLDKSQVKEFFLKFTLYMFFSFISKIICY